MQTSIIIEFFEADLPNIVREGRLFINEGRKNYFEFEGDMKEVVKKYPVVYAIDAASDVKYTFINCFFSFSDFSTYRFVINELYKGCFLNKVTFADCIETESRITGLTNWINHSRIKPIITSSTNEPGTVALNQSFSRTFIIGKNISLELTEFCGKQYSKNQAVLTNLSSLKFKSSEPISRLEMYKYSTSFSKLLSLFTEFVSKFIRQSYLFNNQTEANYLSLRKVKEPDENAALLTYDILEPYLPKAFELFYKDRDKFVKILDLYIESIENSTAEISFLNITTAFEVFHKYFLQDENEGVRKRLHDELLEIGLIGRKTKIWQQIIRHYHLFKHAEDIDSVKDIFPNQIKAITLITESRNYYTHYTKTDKAVWTPNGLLYINRALRQLLKALILKQLGIPNDVGNKLLRGQNAFFYHDYEKNEYSVHYIKSKSIHDDVEVNE